MSIKGKILIGLSYIGMPAGLIVGGIRMVTHPKQGYAIMWFTVVLTGLIILVGLFVRDD